MNLVAALALLVCVSLSVAATRHWLEHLGRDWPQYASLTLLMSMPLVILLTGVGLFGRLSQNLDLGLLGAWGLSLVYYLWARRLAPELVFRPRPSRKQRWAMGAVLLLVFVVYTIIALKYQMHDEHALFGHKSMIEQLRNGDYPPFLPPLPEQAARYHYGFDILAGTLARAFNWSSDIAIDVLTIYLALLISIAAAAVVSSAKPKLLAASSATVAAFAAFAIHFSSGWAWFLLSQVDGRHPRCLLQYHHPSCGIDPFYPVPLLNVFQHPVSLGLVLFLVLILVVQQAWEARKKRGCFLPIIVVIVPALALSQVVYFALGVLAVLASMAWSWTRLELRQERDRKFRALFLFLSLALGVGLAVAAGGMFTPSEVNETGLIVRRETFGFPVGASLFEMWRQHLANLGFGFLLLPVFVLVALLQRRWTVLVLAAFASGGILVPHIWNYNRSWDIVKFPSAAAFALALLCVILIDGNVWINAWFRRLGRVLLVTGGVMAATYLIVPPEPEWRFYEATERRVDGLVGQTIQWWRDNSYDKKTLIYAQSNIATMLSVYGGLSVVASDSDFHYLGIRADVLRAQRRHRQMIQGKLDATSLAALGVGWLMFSNEELNNLGPEARRQLSNSERFELVATFEATHPSKTRKIWKRLR